MLGARIHSIRVKKQDGSSADNKLNNMYLRSRRKGQGKKEVKFLTVDKKKKENDTGT